MGESTGRISFINSHDYVSDLDGTPGRRLPGFLENRGRHGRRPVNAISASATHPGDGLRGQVRSHGRLFDTETSLADQRPLETQATDRGPARSFEGPFQLRAVLTLDRHHS